jgi:hypothetical protein
LPVKLFKTVHVLQRAISLREKQSICENGSIGFVAGLARASFGINDR